MKWTLAFKKILETIVLYSDNIWLVTLELWRQDQSDIGSDKQLSEDFLSLPASVLGDQEGQSISTQGAANPQHMCT